MENPSCWKTAELVIGDAYEDWSTASSRGMIGGSLAITIANALRNSGHLNDSDEPEIGWDKLRKHYHEREQAKR